MIIHNAEFVISAVGPAQFPEDGLPEIALAGRSNVGKSSLINRMINRKNLARTSSQPGKTQTLNYYRVNNNMHFVDFPGYGYAKVSKSRREEWGKMIEAYITTREQLQLVLCVIDMRHPPSKDDQMMYEWLTHFDIPRAVVATKADKLPKSQWQKHFKVIKQTLNLRPEDKMIMFSSELGLGRDELWDLLKEVTEDFTPIFVVEEQEENQDQNQA
jgi:GTP-binding protein